MTLDDNSSWSRSTNSTEEQMDGMVPKFDRAYDSSLIVLSVLIIAANAMVLVLFAQRPRLRTKTNCLLVSLAVSDLGMGLIGIPTYIGCTVTYLSPLCIGSAVSYRFVAVSTMFHIFAVTVERYISIIHPMNYMMIVNRRRIYRVITVIWVFSLFYSLIQLSWMNDTVWDATKEEIIGGLVYHSFGAIFCFTAPFLAMSFIYAQMFAAIHKQVMDIRKQHIATESKNFSPIYTELRAITVFATMLGIFAFCWVTWYVSIFHMYVLFKMNIPELGFLIFDFLRFSTSLVNAMLYTYLKHDFRMAIKSFFNCKGRRSGGSITKSYVTQVCETQCSVYDQCDDTKC